MAGIERPRVEQLPHLARQAEETQRVRHRGAVAAHLARDLFLGEPQLLLQAMEGLGLFERAQLLALDVLDQGQLEQAVVGHVTHDDRDRGQACLLGGAPAPLAGDDLEPGAQAAHEDRLHHPALADGRGQLAQARGIHGRARLEGIGIEDLHGRLGRRLRRGGGLRIRQKCGEPLAERLSSHGPSLPLRGPGRPPPPWTGCRRGGSACRSSAPPPGGWSAGWWCGRPAP